MVRLSQTTDALLKNNFLTENKEIQWKANKCSYLRLYSYVILGLIFPTLFSVTMHFYNVTVSFKSIIVQASVLSTCTLLLHVDNYKSCIIIFIMLLFL